MIITPEQRRSLDDRLVKDRRTRGCWVWGGRDGKGRANGWYVMVTVDGRRFNLRRLLYALHHGLPRVPDRKVRLATTCHNPRCVNPHHMRIADAAEQEDGT